AAVCFSAARLASASLDFLAKAASQSSAAFSSEDTVSAPSPLISRSMSTSESLSMKFSPLGNQSGDLHGGPRRCNLRVEILDATEAGLELDLVESREPPQRIRLGKLVATPSQREHQRLNCCLGGRPIGFEFVPCTINRNVVGH